MEKDILIKYRDNNKELDLLGVLDQKREDLYNEEYKKLIKILVLMLSITEKNSLSIQQVLFHTIYMHLDEILISQQNTDDFVNILYENRNEENANINSFIFRFILNIKDNVDGIGSKENIDVMKGALKQLNVVTLKNAIDQNKDYELIVKLFYNCVDDMESNRRVILHENAIEKFRRYIEEKPIGYLKYFLRPYYSGPNKHHLEYYLHVGEPFNNQIFPNDGEFVEYLNEIRDNDVDIKLIADVKMFFERVSTNLKNENKTLILYSSEIQSSEFRENYKRLLSFEHKWARPECLPPNYRSK